MKEKTDELHERYYQKFWRLQKNADALSNGVIDVMRQNILNEYRNEYAIMHAADMIEIKRQLHALEVKGAHLIPRKLRFRLFWKRPNRAEDQLDREMLAIAEKFFEKKERSIQELFAALDHVDDDPRNVQMQPESISDEQAAEQPEASGNKSTEEAAKVLTQENSQAPHSKGKRNKQSGMAGQVPGQMSMDELANDKDPHDDQPGKGQPENPGGGTSSAISKKD